MLKPNAAADRSRTAVTEKAHLFPTEVFESFSREELLIVLSLMRRVLDADKRRDVKRIMTELPALFANRSDTRNASSDDHLTEGIHGGPSSKRDDAYHLLRTFLTRLSRAQSKIDSATIGRVTSAKDARHLSPREIAVLSWMKEGKTNEEIASILGLRERTVRFYVSSVLEKLDVTSRTQAVARALIAGLIAS